MKTHGKRPSPPGKEKVSLIAIGLSRPKRGVLPPLKHRTSTPIYCENQVSSGVSCSFDQEDLRSGVQKDDQNASFGMYFALKAREYLFSFETVDEIETKKAGVKGKTKKQSRLRGCSKAEVEETPLALVISTKEKLPHHRQTHSLVHNPLSAGLAKIKREAYNRLRAFIDPCDSPSNLAQPVQANTFRSRSVQKAVKQRGIGPFPHRKCLEDPEWSSYLKTDQDPVWEKNLWIEQLSNRVGKKSPKERECQVSGEVTMGGKGRVRPAHC